MIAVIDTNVLISAALRNRLPERVVLYIATAENWVWVVTPDILNEYRAVLDRPKFALSQEIRTRWSELLTCRTVMIEPPALGTARLPRDPKDEPFLAAVLASEADYLITGDKDLMERQTSLAGRIVSAAEFARLFGIT